jgi:hypothetical protein
MDKKFQIFVSSTFEDLREAREGVIRTILGMGHFPVGMEMFSAGDESQWELIQRQIDESDYYVVLVAHRYGSTDKTGVSYTEKEYDYACSKGVPTIGFVLQDDAKWSARHVDTDPKKKKKLDAFKAKIKRKIINFWSSPAELPGLVSVALTKEFNLRPRTGWVRANNAASPETANELSRLSKENAELREQVAMAQDEEHAVTVASDLLSTTTQSLSFWYEDGTKWEDSTQVNSLLVFANIGPELLSGGTVTHISYVLALAVCPNRTRRPRASTPLPKNTFHGVLFSLMSLGLLKPPDIPTNDDDVDRWSLTPRGLQVLTSFWRKKMAWEAKRNGNGGAPTQSNPPPSAG